MDGGPDGAAVTVLDRDQPAVLPSARTEAAGTHLPRVVTSRAIARAAALLVWGWLALAPLVILLGPNRFDVPTFLSVVAAMAVVAAVGTGLALRRPGSLPLVVGLGSATAAVGIAVFNELTPAVGEPSNPAVSLMGTSCLVLALVLPRGPAIGAALALALWESWWDLGPPWSAPAVGYLEMLLTAAVALAGGRLLVVALLRSSTQVSELVTRLLAERRADHERLVREQALAAARTDLHDTVLTTLSGIGAGWLASASPAELRAELIRDLRLLERLDRSESTEDVDLAAAIPALTATSLFDRLTVRVTGAAACPVPAPAADTLLMAVREALVNVLKHAGTDRAEITLHATDEQVRVQVADAGRGFDPTDPAHGLGLLGVRGRLAELGGAAEVTSAPGRGTTVTLVVPVDTPAAPRPVPPLWSVEGPRRGALAMTVVAGVSQTLSFSLQIGSYADPLPHALGLVLALSVDAVVVATLIRSRRMPGWLSLLLIAKLVTVLLLTGLALPGCASMGYQHFSGGGEFFTCIAITLLRPRREALLALAGYVGVWSLLGVPLYRAGETCGITSVANSAMAVGLVVGTMTLVAALRRHATIAAEVLAAEEALAAARAARQLRTAERRRLLPVVRGIVTDTLTGLTTGRLDAADPAVRELCRRDARLLRSFLTQAGGGSVLVGQLFARAVALRSTGVDLSVRGTLPRDAVSPGSRAALLAALDTCLALVTAEGWVGTGTVTVLRAGDEVLVTLVLLQAPVGITGSAVRLALLDADPGGPRLDRAELADGDLWITWRGGSTPTPAPDPPGAPG